MSDSRIVRAMNRLGVYRAALVFVAKTVGYTLCLGFMVLLGSVTVGALRIVAWVFVVFYAWILSRELGNPTRNQPDRVATTSSERMTSAASTESDARARGTDLTCCDVDSIATTAVTGSQ